MEEQQYLIYDTEAEAIARADENGKRIGYAYWKAGQGTKWATAPQVTADDKWALRVDYKYELTDAEEAALVPYSNVNWPTEEE
jgi:hypothetical protein